MSYSIWPQEMARVSRQTAADRDQLQDNLRRVDPPLGQARDGAGAPVAAALEQFGAEQGRATREILARIDSALVNGDLAVAAYVNGDIEMAAEYGRASVVFTAPRPVLPPGGAIPPTAPELVSGG